MKRLLDALARHRGKALSIYLTAGHPSLSASRAHFDAAIQGGAHWIEFGIPFSDPVADGPVIEAAAGQALSNGMRVADALGLAAQVRLDHPDTPLVAMTYANIAYHMGWDAWARALAEHGFDGCILPDVPLEESGPVRRALAAHDLAWIPLVTPTTSQDRMQRIAATATGFLYVVGNVGITGQDDPGTLVEATVARARQAAPDTPLCVGFGIRSQDDVRRVLASGADGAIVGSHIVAAISAGASPEETRDAVADLLP